MKWENDTFGLVLRMIDKAKSIHLRQLSEGLVSVNKNFNGYGFYNTDGDEIIKSKYEDAGFFSEGLAPVKLNGQWGYVNHAGKDTFDEQ